MIKKIRLKKVENQEILIEHYAISEITTIHEIIDITDKRSDKTERVYRGNIESIDSVFIKNDTIFLTTTQDNPLIYDLVETKFGYKTQVVKMLPN